MSRLCPAYPLPLIGEYKYLFEGTPEPTRALLRDAFDQLQRDLAELERDWTSTPEQRAHNRSHFRPLPSEMDTGPGY